jgi:hypothetical protein
MIACEEAIPFADENHRAFNKGQTRDAVTRSFRNIKRRGIYVIATFAVGYDRDTKEDN